MGAMSFAATKGQVAALEKPVRVGSSQMRDIAAVYEACLGDLFGYAASLTRDHASAEDIVQEAFTRLVNESVTRHLPENPRAWLYTVTTNLAFSRSRRRAVADRWQQLLGRPDRAEAAEAAEATVLRSERHGELNRALGALPKDHGAALLLAADGFSGTEIAAILGKSEGATRNILWRARSILRDRLQAGEAT